MTFFRSITGQAFLFLLAGIVASTAFTIAIAVLHVRHPFLILIFSACILALAYAVALRFTRPLRNLAAAAGRLGSDINSEPLAEAGPTEVREAAAAFNLMQSRIRRDFLERTSMLAAITHDLQTPLTRLRLRLEKVENEALRAKLLDDLSAMRETVNEGLDLARSLEDRTPRAVVDLDSLLSSLCEDARDAGADVTLSGVTGAAILCVPNDLRRCLTNLVDNAVAYGHYARIDAAAGAGWATITILDGGPGIAQEHLERAFDPFYRLESSRSRETGGSGLGLTIARNIVRRYGGEITIANLPEGGLAATVRLPLAASPR
jgi:signal transduction histidine kinase